MKKGKITIIQIKKLENTVVNNEKLIEGFIRVNLFRQHKQKIKGITKIKIVSPFVTIKDEKSTINNNPIENWMKISKNLDLLALIFKHEVTSFPKNRIINKLIARKKFKEYFNHFFSLFYKMKA